MSAMPDSTFADPKDHLIADLQRQLAECKAERDEVQRSLIERTPERDETVEQQTATAEGLQVIAKAVAWLVTLTFGVGFASESETGNFQRCPASERRRRKPD